MRLVRVGTITLLNLEQTLYFIARTWSSGMMRPCHGRDPGSIPGVRNLFVEQIKTWLYAALFRSLV